MLKELYKIKENFLDVLFPKTCLGCGKEGRYICDDCSLFISEAPAFWTEEGFEVTSMWQCQDRQDIITRMIERIKDRGLTSAISELAERAFFEILRDEERFRFFLSFLLDKDTYITYVPLYKYTERKRGFNQAQLIAQAMGRIADKKTISLLKRTRETASQKDLDKNERIENVRDAFEFSSSSVPHNVILVDDTWVSGATMKECAKVLKEAGVKNIQGFTLGRVV